MPKLEAVLFDLDGTMLDSAPDLCQALNHTLEADGRPPLTLEQVKPMLGDGIMEMCRRALLATGGVTADDLYPYVQKFIGYYRTLPPAPEQVFDGVRNSLEELKKAGIKLGVCTNKQEAATKHILDTLGLSPYFGFIAGGDTFQVHKPHPGHITQTLTNLGVHDTDHVVFVGDGPNDIVASERANVACIVITHGYTEDYNSIKADAKIDNMNDLIPTLRAKGFTF